MVGGVLVERTVKEVLPALVSNRDKMGKLIESLDKQLKDKEQKQKQKNKSSNSELHTATFDMCNNHGRTKDCATSPSAGSIVLGTVNMTVNSLNAVPVTAVSATSAAAFRAKLIGTC